MFEVLQNDAIVEVIIVFEAVLKLCLVVTHCFLLVVSCVFRLFRTVLVSLGWIGSTKPLKLYATALVRYVVSNCVGSFSLYLIGESCLKLFFTLLKDVQHH